MLNLFFKEIKTILSTNLDLICVLSDFRIRVKQFLWFCGIYKRGTNLMYKKFKWKIEVRFQELKFIKLSFWWFLIATRPNGRCRKNFY